MSCMKSHIHTQSCFYLRLYTINKLFQHTFLHMFDHIEDWNFNFIHVLVFFFHFFNRFVHIYMYIYLFMNVVQRDIWQFSSNLCQYEFRFISKVFHDEVLCDGVHNTMNEWRDLTGFSFSTVQCHIILYSIYLYFLIVFDYFIIIIINLTLLYLTFMFVYELHMALCVCIYISKYV